MDVLMIIIGAVLFLIYLRECGKQKRPVKSMLANSLSGAAALVISAVVTGFMGCGVAVNYATVFLSSVLGIPGVIMILFSAIVI